jgi:hypothetical protein
LILILLWVVLDGVPGPSLVRVMNRYVSKPAEEAQKLEERL